MTEYVRLSREDLERWRDTHIELEAAQAGAHLHSEAYVRARHRFWKEWDRLGEKYNLPEVGEFSLGLRTGTFYYEDSTSLAPLEKTATESGND
jgi:hypothetical protein